MNFFGSLEQQIASLEDGGSQSWRMRAGIGSVFHIPVWTVFDFGKYEKNKMLTTEKVKNKEKKVVRGKYRFDGIKRNVLDFSRYPPRLDSYGVINHGAIFSGQSSMMDFQGTSLMTERIPLVNFGKTGDWQSLDVGISAVPPMGVLPIGTVVIFGSSLDSQPQEGESLPVRDYFQERYKTGTFAKHLVKSGGSWVITGNAGVNTQGLVRNLKGDVKRFYSRPYILRKMNNEKSSIDIGQLKLYASNEQNRIELRAEDLHHLLWLSCNEMRHRYGADGRLKTIVEYTMKQWEDVELIPFPIHPFDNRTEMRNTMYEEFLKKMNQEYIDNFALHAQNLVCISPVAYHSTFVQIGANWDVGLMDRPYGKASEDDMWFGTKGNTVPYYLPPLHIREYDDRVGGLDKENSIYSPLNINNFFGSEEDVPFIHQQMKMRQFPVFWFIERWLFNKPSYGGPKWAQYQGSTEYKITQLSEKGNLMGFALNLSGANKGDSVEAYNLVGKQYQK